MEKHTFLTYSISDLFPYLAHISDLFQLSVTRLSDPPSFAIRFQTMKVAPESIASRNANAFYLVDYSLLLGVIGTCYS